MDDFWVPTKQMYEQLFQRPIMSEALLKRPPFRYILDIIIQIQKQTGYGQGLYEPDELIFENYYSKESKCIFLKKIIDLTQLILDENIYAQPLKVICGLDPQNTNLMLQAIYRAATSGKNSDASVSQVLSAQQDDKQKELKDILSSFQELINIQQFIEIFTDNYQKRLNDEISQQQEQLLKQEITDLDIIQGKIEEFLYLERPIIDIINNHLK